MGWGSWGLGVTFGESGQKFKQVVHIRVGVAVGYRGTGGFLEGQVLG